jgi:hypothetical protein
MAGRFPDSRTSESVVVRWVDALNARDFDAAIACLDPQAIVRPLRRGAAEQTYQGHAGVRAWFDVAERQQVRGKVALTHVRRTGGGALVVLGALSAGDEHEPASFVGLYRIEDERIVVAHHFRGDRETTALLALRGRGTTA